MENGTDGMTVLHLAAKSGNLEACKLILKSVVLIRDAINAADDGGWSPLVWACEHGHKGIALYLIKKGADPLLTDVEHNTSLHWAAFTGNEDIVEMLLNCGCDVNAVNAHGDTPLHLAARQDCYNCVLILLARGANVNDVNKSGESPLDCTPPDGDSFAIISFNLQIHAAIGNKSIKTILTNDISQGKETNPIQCVNKVDDEERPIDFIYISKNCIASDAVQIDQRITTLQSCSCEQRCSSPECNCFNNSLRCWYDEEGKLVIDFDYSDPPIIFECNELCGCNVITCGNRVVQRGHTQRFQLYKTKSKGWGVKTLKDISKGTFVCEYVGEIITDLEANQREDDTYLFDLDSKGCVMLQEADCYCIDAKQHGNLSRFFNHSCEANLVPVRVFIDHHDLRFPRIAFFAIRNILADEELCFDYGEKFWLVKYKLFTCNCDSENCKYSTTNIMATVENYNKKFLEN